MSHRFEEIKPPHHPTKEEVQEMIDAAIKHHNHTASIISAILGTITLALFLDGLLRLLGIVPPFMGIDINILKEIITKYAEQIQ